ncbi:hypothetical protein [Nocardioides daejeonensis]|uniref:hypothetical protein n=1 Tax=Nocardioides daejeonensis TaxID=1046556 RepID=UPI000D745119|nr:hypothetical protein [Nocardioides daejeonensis]
MRSKVIGLAAAGATVATLGLAAAAHASPATVEVAGSSADADYPFYALAADPNPSDPTAMAIQFSVRNASNNIINMGCKQVHAEGNVHGGPVDLDGDAIATIQAVSRANTPEGFSHSEWKGCKGPVNLDMTVVPLNDWEIHGYPPVSSGNDVIPGYISGPAGAPLRANVYATTGSSGCSFEVEGYANGSFDEGNQTLSVNETGYTGNLKVVVAGGGSTCLGLVGDGNAANFEGDFVVGDDNAANTKSGITHFFPINVY